MKNGAEVDNRNFVQVKVHIPAALYNKIEAWLDGDGSYEPGNWEEFIEAAAAVLPCIAPAYGIYTDQYAHFVSRGEVSKPMMTLAEFVHYLVNREAA